MCVTVGLAEFVFRSEEIEAESKLNMIIKH